MRAQLPLGATVDALWPGGLEKREGAGAVAVIGFGRYLPLTS